ncbi:MAG TPA: amidohydrolase, partial [Firmicutes bacterium]|nr:amidohydrolase [Bacillota bacterium]
LIISFGRLEGGSALNVIPGEITLGGTVRTLSESTAGFALRRLQEILAGLRFTHGVEGVMEEGEKEPPLVCDRAVTAYAERLLKTMWGEHRVELLPEPSMGAEDFAQFSRVVPSTYLRFGVRDEEKGFTYPLHHPAFDFGEEILPVAVASLAFLLLEWGKG